MSVTFKKFSSFVDSQEELTEEQISEIFGLFQNNKKIQDLKKKREDLLKMKGLKQADIDKIKNKMWSDAKAQMAKGEMPSSSPKFGAGRTSTAAQNRDAEVDWLSTMMSKK